MFRQLGFSPCIISNGSERWDEHSPKQRCRSQDLRVNISGLLSHPKSSFVSRDTSLNWFFVSPPHNREEGQHLLELVEGSHNRVYRSNFEIAQDTGLRGIEEKEWSPLIKRRAVKSRAGSLGE